MFPDASSRFLDMPSCRGWRASDVCRPMLGRSRAASQPAPRRRASSSPSIASMSQATTCGGSTGGPTAGRTGSIVKEFEADTNLRCCLVLDTSGSMDFGSDGTTKIEYARQARRGAWATWRSSRATRWACTAWPAGIVTQHPAAAQPGPPDDVFDVLEQARPAGRDPARAGAARTGRDDSPAGPDRHRLGPVRRAGGAPLAASSTCGSASTTWRSFTCSTRRSSTSISAGRCGSSTWKAARRSSPSRTRSPSGTTRRSAAT